MKFILIIICLLLLFYHFESTQLLSKNANENIVITWKLPNKKLLLHIFPHDEYVLIDGKSLYLYIDKNQRDTYAKAIHLSTKSKQYIVNYYYLLDWSIESPKLNYYPTNLLNIVDIINYFSD